MCVSFVGAVLYKFFFCKCAYMVGGHCIADVVVGGRAGENATNWLGSVSRKGDDVITVQRPSPGNGVPGSRARRPSPHSRLSCYLCCQVMY